LKLRFTGTFPAPPVVSFQPLVIFTTDTIEGYGTHLGRFTATYPHSINFDPRTFTGTAVFPAANGD
jgi:hypothetical protein